MKYSVNFFNEDVTYRIRHKRLLKDWIRKSILKENKNPGDINIILCTDEYLLNLNQKYLQHNDFTDVITFDNSENETISGDIFISIERVSENALKFSKNSKEELHRVIIHGVLHLCGYKDKIKKDFEEMRATENFHLAHRPEDLMY